MTYVDAPASLLLGELGAPAQTERASPETARRIDAAVQTLLQSAHDRALAILRDNREVLDRCAAALIAHETLDEDALCSLTADLHRPPLPVPIRQAA